MNHPARGAFDFLLKHPMPVRRPVVTLVDEEEEEEYSEEEQPKDSHHDLLKGFTGHDSDGTEDFLDLEK